MRASRFAAGAWCAGCAPCKHRERLRLAVWMISGLRAATRMNLILREDPPSPSGRALGQVFCAVSYLVIPGHLRLDCGKNGSVVSNVQTNRDERTSRRDECDCRRSFFVVSLRFRASDSSRRKAKRCSCSDQGNRATSWPKFETFSKGSWLFSLARATRAIASSLIARRILKVNLEIAGNESSMRFATCGERGTLSLEGGRESESEREREGKRG